MRSLVRFLPVLLLPIACSTTEPERSLDVTFVDVGQGSSILIETPDRRTCLIDAGPTFAGANRVCPLLDSLGITELDYTIATNYTPGRIGGLDEVIRHLGGEEGVLYRCYDRGSATAGADFRDYNRVAGSRRERMRPGELLDLGDLSIWCLASGGRVVGQSATRPTDERDRSIALHVSYGDFDMLVLGDLTGRSADGRLPLADDVARLAEGIDLLVVPDLGSADAVSARLRQEVDAPVAVIPVGSDAPDLPAQRTVNCLTHRGGRVYTTGRAENIIIPAGSGRAVGGSIRVTVSRDWFTVAGDTFRQFN
jgi:beta-lactamase superfamily II metal-dependent hydrolase